MPVALAVKAVTPAAAAAAAVTDGAGEGVDVEVEVEEDVDVDPVAADAADAAGPIFICSLEPRLSATLSISFSTSASLRSFSTASLARAASSACAEMTSMCPARWPPTPVPKAAAERVEE